MALEWVREETLPLAETLSGSHRHPYQHLIRTVRHAKKRRAERSCSGHSLKGPTRVKRVEWKNGGLGGSVQCQGELPMQ